MFAQFMISRIILQRLPSKVSAHKRSILSDSFGESWICLCPGWQYIIRSNCDSGSTCCMVWSSIHHWTAWRLLPRAPATLSMALFSAEGRVGWVGRSIALSHRISSVWHFHAFSCGSFQTHACRSTCVIETCVLYIYMCVYGCGVVSLYLYIYIYILHVYQKLRLTWNMSVLYVSASHFCRSTAEQSLCSNKLVKKYIDKSGKARCCGIKPALKESAYLV